MDLRRQVGDFVIKRKTLDNFGKTRLRYMSAADERLPKNANAQGIVIKVEQRNQYTDSCLESVMLPGDSDAETWRASILKDYSVADVQSSILLAAHHGSNSFFSIQGESNWYVSHLIAIKPAMTIVPVGPNTHGHPDQKALEFYEQYSSGSNQGEKVVNQ
jgi:beta-lactamase superfamily II metal-dependent hydrolase